MSASDLCPYHDAECIPGDTTWQCFDCAAEAHGDVPDTWPWVFLYGTLMDGLPNNRMMPVAASGPISARTPGEMYYVHGRTGFPVVAPTAENEWVFGELWRVPPTSPAWLDVVQMEIGAGYDVRWTNVVRQDDGSRVQALMFTWPWAERGERIPHGNWRRRS